MHINDSIATSQIHTLKCKRRSNFCFCWTFKVCYNKIIMILKLFYMYLLQASFSYTHKSFPRNLLEFPFDTMFSLFQIYFHYKLSKPKRILLFPRCSKHLKSLYLMQPWQPWIYLRVKLLFRSKLVWKFIGRKSGKVWMWSYLCFSRAWNMEAN